MTRKVEKPYQVIALALLALGVGGPTALAQTNSDGAYTSSQTSDQVSLVPGTVIPVLLGTELSSNNSQAGDTFTATVDTSRGAYDSLMRGATVDGVVRRAKPQSGTDPGTLELAFTRLRAADGTTYPIAGTVTSLDQKDLQVRPNGTLQAVKVNKDQSTTYAGIGAGAGLLIGILDGGKVRLGDVLLGGGLGYAAAQLLKGTQQVHDVDLKAGTPVGVLLGQRVLYHRTGARGASSHEAIITSVRSGSLRYYTYQGQRWSYNPATGVRARVLSSSRAARTGGLRYFSYQGHPYSLDPSTGKRTRLD